MTPLLHALLFVAAVASPGAAQQRPAEPAEPAGEAEETEQGFRNEVALVLAGTRERAEDEKETSFTIGLEYQRELTERLAVVVEAEYVNGPDSWVFAMPLVFRPAGEFKLFTGPGFERGTPHEDEGHEVPFAEREKENLLLWRAGAGYSWDVKERYVIGPSFYMDFVHEGDGEWRRAFVFAVAVGVAF
jgi:hypothetical protein